jgi:hypothetical protein
VLGCFKKRGEHEAETIARRLLGRKATYEERAAVKRLLTWLVQEGRLLSRYHERKRNTRVYMLPTEERLREREAKRKRQEEQWAAEHAKEARMEAAIKTLHTRGFESAGEAHAGYDVSLSLEDVERLLASSGG